MAEPVVTMEINTGTELAPVWTDVPIRQSVFFNNANSTSGFNDKLIVSRDTTLEAPEMWLSEKLYHVSGTQCATFVVPSVVGQTQNVIRFTFTGAATTTPPRLKAWDDSGATTITKPIFVGTADSGNTSLLKATETTGGAPIQNWCLINTQVAGAAATNSLEGNTHYVECAALAGAGTSKIFTLALFVPSDLVNVSASEFNIYLQMEYDWI